VGGVRVSLYNAMPDAGVDALIDFMAFARRRGRSAPCDFTVVLAALAAGRPETGPNLRQLAHLRAHRSAAPLHGSRSAAHRRGRTPSGGRLAIAATGLDALLLAGPSAAARPLDRA
jgi:hypothetical protein